MENHWTVPMVIIGTVQSKKLGAKKNTYSYGNSPAQQACLFVYNISIHFCTPAFMASNASSVINPCCKTAGAEI